MPDSREWKHIALGALVGFASAFCYMHYGCRTAFPASWMLEMVVRAPSMTLMLIPQLITNRFLSWMEISLATAASWAMICGLLVAVWQSHKSSRRQKCSALCLSIFVIGAVVVCSWIVAVILCIPFGFCLFRENLTSIASPSLIDISMEMGASLPRGVQLVYSHHSSFQGDHEFTAKIRVQNSALAALRESIPAMHRASRQELRSIPRPKDCFPWYDLRSASALHPLEHLKIPAKGFNGRSSLVEGEIWLSRDESGGAVLYLSGWGK